MIKITESPRDAMQGLKEFIPTESKLSYINKLFRVGFDVIDIGSLVSERAVPQMRDSAEVIRRTVGGQSRISLLTANSRYAQQAARIPEVDCINYPFSISESFLQKNLKSDFEKSYQELDKIIRISKKADKQPVITVSSAFGNPYGDPWSTDILIEHTGHLYERGLRYIPLADTTSEADADKMFDVFTAVSQAFPDVTFNMHIHTYPEETAAKIKALYNAGCRSFDTVLNGMGGCPMTGRQMVANLNTVDFVNWLEEKNIPHNLQSDKLFEAAAEAERIFGRFTA